MFFLFICRYAFMYICIYAIIYSRQWPGFILHDCKLKILWMIPSPPRECKFFKYFFGFVRNREMQRL